MTFTQTEVSNGARAFDAHHPPAPELIADCVHCGFCLPTCPTYLLWSEEMDSPRGRIYLMKLASEGAIGLTDEVVRHWDLCLGCMACVTACPSGVQYEKLIEATRQQVERRYDRAPADRAFRALLFALFPHPGRLRAMVPALWLYQRAGLGRLARAPLAARVLPARLRGLEAVMPPVRLGALTARPPAFTPARGTRRRRVGVLAGCVQRVFFDPVNAATVRVLAAEGCDVVVPRAQGCCGALSFHAGREADGLDYARRLIDAFEAADVDTIVVNAAGCGSTLKEYGYLLRDDPAYAERAAAFSAKVRDVTEFLAELEPVAPRNPVPLRVAYHDACHLGHAQGIRRQPREVLRAIPGLRVLDIPEAEICCGSAGIYNLVEPEPAAELGDRKAGNILATDPEVIATANPGCLLQITAALARRGAAIPTVHPIELVDASIRGVIPVAWFARVGAAEGTAVK
ncbi:MAG TPA: glycolate oxidase subunit GlcF [Thermomicrobiales bacterium]|nr:glycolate oxidase subunit GlcF [Thermomicrobiales bacterium]